MKMPRAGGAGSLAARTRERMKRASESRRAVAAPYAKQFDEAISTFQSLSANKDGEVPADAMLMQLARVYLLAGKVTEARQTFRKLLDEYPQSPFVTEAKREFDQLSQG